MMGNESHSSPARKQAGFSLLRAGKIRRLPALVMALNVLAASAFAQAKITSSVINIPDIQDDRPIAKTVKLIAPNLPALEDKTTPTIVQPPPQIEPFRSISEEANTANPAGVDFLMAARRSSALAVQGDSISTSSWRYRTKDQPEYIEAKRPPSPGIRPFPMPAMESKKETTVTVALASPKEPPKEKATAVDINKATMEEIIKGIPKIDARRAQAIVQFRQLHRPFRTVDELSQVFGITDEQVDLWRMHLSVSQPSE